MPQGTHRDPRSIVTPDAFEVSSALIGMPLAPPRLRFVALMIDGVVIGVIAGVTKSFALILGVVAAVWFVRAGFKRTPIRGSVFSRAMRLSVGCLGVVIALITAATWSAVGFDFRGGDDGPSDDEIRVATGGAAQVIEAVASARALSDLQGSAPPVVNPLPSDARAEIDAYTPEEALNAYARLLRDDPGDSSQIVLRAALADRLLPVIAGDSLKTLGSTVRSLQLDLAATQEALDDVSRELESASERSLIDRLLGFVDELGFGFGWAAVYLTLCLSGWKGQTVGKKLMGIRVVRLDGGAITWWIAFERSGGYAAGLATGLLGFAQVWWDANRQGIHDRIVGTVVVMDGAEPVTDWETAL
ncbi:MAG: RDD family protein [Gemmatimonadetes bacterium]|nr:RDD family protein [Gemmatimonadota bacterium]